MYPHEFLELTVDFVHLLIVLPLDGEEGGLDFVDELCHAGFLFCFVGVQDFLEAFLVGKVEVVVFGFGQELEGFVLRLFKEVSDLL